MKMAVALLVLVGCTKSGTTPTPAPTAAPATSTGASTSASPSASTATPVAATTTTADAAAEAEGITELTLPNGLKVLFQPQEKSSSVSLAVWYEVGAGDEPVGRSGMRRVVEQLLFGVSAHTAPEGFVPHALKAGGSSLDAGSTLDHLALVATYPTSALPYALWLEADRMGFLAPKLDEAAVKRAREAASRRIADEDAQRSPEPRLLGPLLYAPGHPYHRSASGDAAEAAAVTLAEAKAFIETYVHPANATLAIVGGFDLEAAKKLVEDYFAPLDPGPQRPRLRADTAKLAGDKLVVWPARSDVAKVTLAWSGPARLTADDAALSLAADVLGGHGTSRLAAKLVDKDGIATGASAEQRGAALGGQFVIEIYGAKNAAPEALRDAALAEIKKLAEDGPSDAELKGRKAARALAAATLRERGSGFLGRADRLARFARFSGAAAWAAEEERRIAAVTEGEVAGAAKAWLAAAPRIELRIVPSPALAASRGGADRTKPPSLAGSVSADTPGVETLTLTNGLVLHVVQRPGLGKVESALVIKSGQPDEGEASGVGYLTAVSVLDGTKGRDGKSLRAEAEALGVAMAVEGGRQGAALSLVSLPSSFEAALGLLADAAMNPSFPAEALAATHKRREAELEREMTSLVPIAGAMFPRLVYAGHPASAPERGSRESLAKLNREALAAYHAAWWRPNNAALVIAGDISSMDAEKAAKKHFGSWSQGTLPTVTPVAPGRPAKPYVFLHNVQDSSLAVVRVGSALSPVAGAKETAALDIAEALVRSRAQGRFAVEVARGGQVGSWSLGGVVRAGQAVETLVGIKQALSAVAAGPSAAELGAAKKDLSQGYLARLETSSGVVRTLAPRLTRGEGPEALNEYLPALLAVTSDDVKAALTTQLSFQNAAVFVAGDLKVIEDPVRKLEWGEVLVVDGDAKKLR